MLLCKVMSGQADEVANLAAAKGGIKYQGAELDAMKAVASAYGARSLKDLQTVLASHEKELSDDPIIAAHLDSLRDSLMEQNLLRVIEPFSRVEIAHVASLIDLPLAEVETKLSQMILDGKFEGILDQGAGCLIVYDDKEQNAVYKATLDTMCQLDDETTEDDEDVSKTGLSTKRRVSSNAKRMLLESCRALRPGGTYVCVTSGAPSDRMDLFLDLELDWDLVEHREIPKNTIKYHLYALRRRGGVDAARRAADIDPASVVDATSLEVIRVGNSTAAIPVFRDPFHGSSLDMRDRPYRK